MRASLGRISSFQFHYCTCNSNASNLFHILVKRGICSLLLLPWLYMYILGILGRYIFLVYTLPFCKQYFLDNLVFITKSVFCNLMIWVHIICSMLHVGFSASRVTYQLVRLPDFHSKLDNSDQNHHSGIFQAELKWIRIRLEAS